MLSKRVSGNHKDKDESEGEMVFSLNNSIENQETQRNIVER
jgi:hypothetical protein